MTEIELCWPTVRQARFEDLVPAAAAAGFEALTVSADLCRRSGLSHPELRRRLDDAGVRVTGLDGLAGVLPGTGPPCDVAEVLDLAGALGATVCNLSAYGGDPSVSRAALAEATGAVAARAAARGLAIALEFIPDTAVPDLSSALQVVVASGVGSAGILLDTWHLYRSGGDPRQLKGEALARVAALQLADRLRAQDAQPYVPMTGRLLPGEGELPIAAALGAVRRAHPDLPVGIEIYSEELAALAPTEAAAAAAGSLRRLLAELD